MLTALFSLSLLLLSALKVYPASAQTTTNNCHDLTIPVTVTSPRYLLNITIENNYDAEDFTVNISRRDSATAFNPISGNTSATASYSIGATYCTPAKPTAKASTVLVLTHGLGIDRRYSCSSSPLRNFRTNVPSRRYWDPQFNGSDHYSFVRAALAEGYSVFYYDRISGGKSSM